MLNQNQNRFLERLRELGIIPENQGINYKFDPYDTSILKLTWTSPNDKLNNIVNFYIDPNDKTFMRVKDRH